MPYPGMEGYKSRVQDTPKDVQSTAPVPVSKGMQRTDPLEMKRAMRPRPGQPDRASEFVRGWDFQFPNEVRQIHQLVHSDSLAKRLVDLIESNAVGDGLRIDWGNDTVQGLWDNWRWNRAMPSMDAVDLQRQAARALVADGEILFRTDYDTELFYLVNEGSLRLPVRDSRGPAYPGFANGIEYDAKGVPVSYTFSDVFGGSGGLGEYTVPAVDVLHFFDVILPGQQRGRSWMETGIIPMQKLKEFQELVLDAAKASTLMPGFFTYREGSEEEYVPRFDDESDAEYQARFHEEVLKQVVVNAGEYIIAPDGFKWNDIPRIVVDVPTYEIEVKNAQTRVAHAAGVNPKTFDGDLTTSGYQAIRAMHIENQRVYNKAQKILTSFMARVASMWRAKMIAVGAIPALSEVLVTPQQHPYLDPYRQAQSDSLAVAAGLMSRRQLILERGGDPDKVFAELMEEQEMGLGSPNATISDEASSNVKDGTDD